MRSGVLAPQRPYAPEVLTPNYSRSNCPTGKKSVFSKLDGCTFGSQQYCCPDPPQLKDCNWNSGDRGRECINAVCKSTELEVDRSQDGDKGFGGCSCKSRTANRLSTQATGAMTVALAG